MWKIGTVSWHLLTGSRGLLKTLGTDSLYRNVTMEVLAAQV